MNLILESRAQTNNTVYASGAMLTPFVNEDYWLFRVKVSETQAIVGFPKFSTIGIGFAREDQDWNTNLPYACGTDMIVHHIRRNNDEKISRTIIHDAVVMVQDAARELMRTEAKYHGLCAENAAFTKGGTKVCNTELEHGICPLSVQHLVNLTQVQDDQHIL
jgi:hypothetical protein